LIGLLSLGPRLSDQEYSIDDRHLLKNLASQAAPALRSAQLIQQQKGEAAARERMEQELKVARVIQQTLLPAHVPLLAGWELDVFWQPAYSVGGDFYDFITLDDGRMCVIAADVTDKGIPAALVMASARSVLRAAADRLRNPGEILYRVNNTLCPDIPDKMFITCACVIFDPSTGQMTLANAGHNLPYLRRNGEVIEIKATGMPLGLMPDMPYDEVEFQLLPGDTMLMFSDGIDEAHNPEREMFGFDRMRALVRDHEDGSTLIERILDELRAFTGPDWEQEDDVTFVLISCDKDKKMTELTSPQMALLGEIEVPSEEGNELLAMSEVVQLVEQIEFPADRIQQLQTAVSEATMNAMEHGNRYRPDAPVLLRVFHSPTRLLIQIIDESTEDVQRERVEPNLEAKLAGEQTPRGWGLLLIEHMVDELNSSYSSEGHTLELNFYLEGEHHAGE
jgi:serine phosphatase RsbU (regulator of sigma subunit)/anti-sigma regulatory factor (Ser/Thr protein kinase)